MLKILIIKKNVRYISYFRDWGYGKKVKGKDVTNLKNEKDIKKIRKNAMYLQIVFSAFLMF